MIEISRILCPVDYSEPSALALRTAMMLARWYGAEVLVPHVVALALPAVPFAAATPVVLTPEQRAQVDAQLRQFIDAAEPDGVEVTTAVLEGPAVSEVLRQAEDWPADLVVMGTHGRSGFDYLLMGSVTERLLRKADVPVLTVRAGVDPPGTSPPAPFRRILCPVDYSPASLNALRYALSLVQESGGRLTLLHVMEWPVDLSALEVLGAEAARAQRTFPHAPQCRVGCRHESPACRAGAQLAV
jgi:nucleotide-binding universal stress UspA family protein